MNVERRTVLQATGLVAVGGVVAACSTSGSSGAPSSSSAAPAASSSSAAPAASSAAASTAPASSAGGASVAAVSDIPVRGGLILDDVAVVLTQPTAGDVKAFTAICTHQGCLVSQVVENEIICPCHGSRYSGTDGSVIQGPSTQPLAPAGITVDGGNVVLNG